jgi:hypothetical protein
MLPVCRLAANSGTSTNPSTYPVIGSAYEGNYHTMGYGPIGDYIYALELCAGVQKQREPVIGDCQRPLSATITAAALRTRS